MADSREVQFQHDIITAMVAQGWLTGPASGYDRRTALYTEDFLGYFKAAWPERWDKFAKANPNNPDGLLVQKLVRELEQDSTLDVLRHGFKLPGVKIETCSFKPDHGMNPDTLKRYQCNRLRVVPEVSYSPHYREGEYPLLRIDRLDQEDVDLGELQLSHYRLRKRAEHQLRLSEEQGHYGLDPASALARQWQGP